jgi:hypothetical protein
MQEGQMAADESGPTVTAVLSRVSTAVRHNFVFSHEVANCRTLPDGKVKCSGGTADRSASERSEHGHI